jgi:hypothetical protein
MAAAPELAPDNSDHLLRSSTIISRISYDPTKIVYTVFDNTSDELFRLTSKPKKITINGTRLEEVTEEGNEGWYWESLPEGGVLKIKQSKGNEIQINK